MVVAMPKFQDLTGKRIAYWTVVKWASANPTKWLCKCICGKRSVVQAGHLSSGASTNCGCKRKPTAKYNGASIKFPDAYKSWRAMRSRCLNANDKSYKYYGGKGISICKRWDSFKAFVDDMGDRPTGKTLDRINPLKGYSKSNCRWVTQQVQVRHLPQNTVDYKHKTRHGEPRWC